MLQMNIAINLYNIAICLILLVYLWINYNKSEKSNRLFAVMCMFNIFMTFADISSWLLDGLTSPWHFVAHKIVLVIYYACTAPLLLSFAGYLFECYPIGKNIRDPLWRGAVVLCGVQLIFSVLSYWNGMYFTLDENNIYGRGEWFWLSQLIAGSIFLMDAAIIFICRKRIRKRDILFLSGYIFLITIAQTVQILNYGIALTNLGVTLGLLIVFINIQLRREVRMEQQEHELTQNKIALMLSQIQPHFLYNALSAIKYLCKSDPNAAADTVVEFSEYLRGNMDFLTIREPIPFVRELHHVENYLSIEKKRFGDKLKISYAILFSDFKLPPLTLQPIVENAVRYGVTKKEGGGTVVITAQRFGNDAVISVIDDGIGFDPEQPTPHDDGRSQVGISSVRSRLAALCGGTLDYSSTIGLGTTAVITVPIS